MTLRSKSGGAASKVVWDRPEPSKRATPEPLSRERIVRAAIALADKEGLSAVSLRKVGASLDAGPMRLYGYLSAKEELLELMVDAVYEEMATAEPIEGTWREALRTIARRTREATQRHTWFIDLLGGEPHLGPNALAYLEASLHALRDFGDIDTVMLAGKTFNAYVLGAIRSEASELRGPIGKAMSQSEWEQATGVYIQKMIDTGRFPTIAKVVTDATHPPADSMFDQGLECVLDGIAARLLR